MSNVGNVNNFTGASRFKTFYLKLTQKNKLHILGSVAAIVLILSIVLLMQPKQSIFGPSVSNASGKVELKRASCINYSDCDLKTLSNDGKQIKLSLPTGAAISISALDKEYNTIPTQAKIYGDGWLLSIPQGELLLTITQGTDQYQVKLD